MTTRFGNARVQPGAYVHDGKRLYEVEGVVVRHPPMKPSVRKVLMEDASSGVLVEMNEAAVLAMTLVPREND